MNKKPIYRILLYSLIFIISSCSKDSIVNEEQELSSRVITMTASDFKYDNNTRTNFEVGSSGLSFTWAANDTVGIFPDTGGQVYFPMINGAGTNKAIFTGGGWALKPSSQYMAYYPMKGEFYLDKRAIPVNFEGQIQIGNASTAHLGKYDYMVAQATTPNNGNVNFHFEHLVCFVELNLILPDQGTLESLELTANENIFINQGYIDLPKLTIVSQTKSNKFLINCKDIKTSKANENVKLYFILAPTNAKNKVVSVNLFNNGVNYKGTTTLKNFEAGRIYSLTMDITGQSSVFHVKTPGTLANVMSGVNRYSIKNLKVTGPLNSKDIIVIRDIAGVGNNGNHNNYFTPGKLEFLDLSEANFVEGGGYYWEHTDNDIEDPWTEQFCTETDILSKGMFQDCRFLKQIVLPDNITLIGGLAFAYCESLQSIIIPNSVKTLDCFDQYGGIFMGCKNLQYVKFSSNITGRIPGYIFKSCKRLKNIDIPKNVTAIDQGAFEYCDSLTSVTIPDGVTYIGESAFKDCNLEYIKLPKELKLIGAYAFSNNAKLSSLTIPEKVTHIGYDAFGYCPQLLNVCSLPSTPPIAEKHEYQNLYSLGFSENCTIFVLPYAVGDYKYAIGWKDYFNNIKPK